MKPRERAYRCGASATYIQPYKDEKIMNNIEEAGEKGGVKQ